MNIKNFKFDTFMCHECGGKVQLASGTGRRREYLRGMPEMPIPDNFEIPTCVNCGEIYVLPELEPYLQRVLKGAYLEWQKSVTKN